ncbi:conserved hypothetical protein [Uncinocarpus reesii 1704]|uniref:NmrA-like domain-containing protein n=1 Tax=Uncinocarpus reesii (strain UAMH 1704) TaxID=336963 RepID=C4JN13_UNCRE|nr:uncharacterized protein UREG_04221 [Uncinocarpus reesii 1704]EEP79375.1 conserved hypothetical protein [Uncinocarpus reesii 1704]
MAVPTITIFAATGNQGGAVARSLLKNPAFKVRALTRNPNSDASKALAALGAEIQSANGFDIESMKKAVRGSWGVFVNINSDDQAFRNEHGPTEFDMGKTIVDAAAEEGVRHFIFSSATNCTELTGGKVRMKAMDSGYTVKNKIEQYARNIDKFETASFINAAWYLENFLAKEVAPIFGGFPHQVDDEGYLTFAVPKWGGNEDVPFISMSDDFGDLVQGMFLDPQRWNGSVVHGCSDICTFDDLVAAFEKVTGRKSRFRPLPSWEAFDIKGIPELEDPKLMFAFTQATNGRYFGPEPSEKETAALLKQVTSAALGKPEEQRLVSVEDWFRKHFQA